MTLTANVDTEDNRQWGGKPIKRPQVMEVNGMQRLGDKGEKRHEGSLLTGSGLHYIRT